MSAKRIVSLLAFLTAVVLVGLGLWRLTQQSETISQRLSAFRARRETRSAPLVASGFIEAHETTVASEYGGRAITLTVAEGEAVVAGQLLLALDTTLLDAHIEAAAAAVEVAQARENQIAAGPRAGALSVAEAQVARARAARDAAYQAWQDAILLHDNPQELQLEIAAVQTQLQMAEHRLTQSEALHDAASVGYDRYNEVLGEIGPYQRVEVASGPLAALASLLQGILPPDAYQAVMSGADGTYGGGGYEVVVSGGSATVYKSVGLQLDFHLLPYNYWQAGAAVNTAQATRDGAWAALSHLNAVAADPQAAQAQVDAAHSAYSAAQAGLDIARASLDTLQAGATLSELVLARAQVEQAQAALDVLEIQRARTRIRAPRDGVVTRLSIAGGELVVPGMPLLTIADPSDLFLTVYVPVDQLGRVRQSGTVSVRVDSYPDRDFRGVVLSIAGDAEFTPSVTQTQEERVNLVFAVKVSLDDASGALKPGVPADATFVEAD